MGSGLATALVNTGLADESATQGVKEQTKAYPELTDELWEISEIADLLCETGRQRRRLGEEILRQR